jgi:hypothetical protein
MLNHAELPKHFECFVDLWSASQDATVTPTTAYLDIALTERAPAAEGYYVGASPSYFETYLLEEGAWRIARLKLTRHVKQVEPHR